MYDTWYYYDEESKNWWVVVNGMHIYKAMNEVDAIQYIRDFDSVCSKLYEEEYKND